MGLKGSSSGIGTGSGKAYSGKRNAQMDFTGKRGRSTLSGHFQEHGQGFNTDEEYLNAARNFLEKSPTSTTESFVSKDGWYYRYDTATNELVL